MRWPINFDRAITCLSNCKPFRLRLSEASGVCAALAAGEPLQGEALN